MNTVRKYRPQGYKARRYLEIKKTVYCYHMLNDDTLSEDCLRALCIVSMNEDRYKRLIFHRMTFTETNRQAYQRLSAMAVWFGEHGYIYWAEECRHNAALADKRFRDEMGKER